MPLESAVRETAAYLLERDFVLVHAHDDADGIAAGAIICHALQRADVPFRCRICTDVEVPDMKGTPVYCDLGSEADDVPEEAVVVDHHPSLFEGPHHLNPHLFGIDGERELPASGVAYLLAQEMGENADLAGLALVGMLGDRQAIAGENRRIVNEGIASGVIEPSKGLLLAGRDDRERLLYAVDPYLPNVSGNEELCREILKSSSDKGAIDMEKLLSRIVLESASDASMEALTRLYGTKYLLKRECVEDAHTMASLLDACGRSGKGGLGAALCMRYAGVVEEGFALMQHYRRQVTGAIAGLAIQNERMPWVEVSDRGFTACVADVIAWDLSTEKPVAVYARSGDRCRISLRAPRGSRLDLGRMAREIAGACGGSGGGHRSRAGAEVAVDRLPCFREKFTKAIG